MTIFRFEVAASMIDDLLADQDSWWDGEIETVTGYPRDDFKQLRLRLAEQRYELCGADRFMLRHAANTLLGYPGCSTANVSRVCGERWKEEIASYLEKGSRP